MPGDDACQVERGLTERPELVTCRALHVEPHSLLDSLQPPSCRSNVPPEQWLSRLQLRVGNVYSLHAADCCGRDRSSHLTACAGSRVSGPARLQRGCIYRL